METKWDKPVNINKQMESVSPVYVNEPRPRFTNVYYFCMLDINKKNIIHLVSTSVYNV